jgi:hypothetical protein
VWFENLAAQARATERLAATTQTMHPKPQLSLLAFAYFLVLAEFKRTAGCLLVN